MTQPKLSLLLTIWVTLAFVCVAWSQTSDLVPVLAKPVSRTIDLPGEIAPFLTVSLHAKVPGYVERILVDRGSVVKHGELLAELTAPEMAAQIARLSRRHRRRTLTASRLKLNLQRRRALTIA